MADYTHEYSNFPEDTIFMKSYKDVDNTIASVVAQIEAAKASGDYELATTLINNNPNLSDYDFSASDVNRFAEEIRNAQIFALKHVKAFNFGGDYYDGEVGDLWIGPKPTNVQLIVE